MLNFELDNYLIDYDSELKSFVTEASDLNLSPRFWNSNIKVPIETKIELTNTKSGVTKEFKFVKADIHYGEVHGWNYRTEGDNIKLLIIND